MKIVSLFLLSCCIALSAAAQKVFFIYLETDNNPFYIRMGEQTRSSTSPGYLILSNLVDSTYSVAVGFSSRPGESRFNIPLQGRDHGFKIRIKEDGIQLVDLQSGAVISAQKDDRQNISYES